MGRSADQHAEAGPDGIENERLERPRLRGDDPGRVGVGLEQSPGGPPGEGNSNRTQPDAPRKPKQRQAGQEQKRRYQHYREKPRGQRPSQPYNQRALVGRAVGQVVGE